MFKTSVAVHFFFVRKLPTTFHGVFQAKAPRRAQQPWLDPGTAVLRTQAAWSQAQEAKKEQILPASAALAFHLRVQQSSPATPLTS